MTVGTVIVIVSNYGYNEVIQIAFDLIYSSK